MSTSSAAFVWSKMQAESGQSLDAIIARKEAERVAGNGVFWWGIGNSLGRAVQNAAEAAGGTLPVLFSKMRSQPQAHDVSPSETCRWIKWQDQFGTVQDVPDYARVISRVNPNRSHHYALVCFSSSPLALIDHGPFDPTLCRTLTGKAPGASQVTSMLQGKFEGYTSGAYRMGFRATLVAPWAVKLVMRHADARSAT